MAGHNKWSKVKHRKAVVDKRRSKVWSKVSRAIIVAARHGGADPNFNVALRQYIDEARYANMPRDVIERAIQKGSGGGDTSAYESVRYEGYGPAGVAVLVDALTDNRTRTAADVRNMFADHGGNLGASGCVAYLFQPRGTISVAAAGLSEDRVMEAAIAAGALDALPPDDPGDDEAAWTITTRPDELARVKAEAERAGLAILHAGLEMTPDTLAPVSGEAARSVIALLDGLEELDDVQKVYSNADITDPAPG